MMNVLKITSSARGQVSESTRLADNYITALRAVQPELKVVTRDLATDALPHIDGNVLGAFFTPAEQRTAEQQALIARSDALVAELQAADAIVLAVPMYNFGIPSTLKAYFDWIARAGVTFKYTPTGPVGLLADKPVTVFAARGGLYQGTPHDTQTGYLKDFLGFIGLKSVEFVYAEGLNMGDELRAKAEAEAASRIAELVAD
ncbi:FMN-dependent NADH-azoreductase [Microvirgula aerodenitrificans]|uniref:FMN dependent NADH:quinone oxidoreductase n=2 Tax=Aquaspirillaceae TaxID=2897176 RepID=A0A2S0P6T1_9NEIS|nr:FMN-dependent NADH-azoreductase [Microvirgula aerodenitrificans]